MEGAVFGSVELKFQVVAHHRLICDAGRWDETAMGAAFAGRRGGTN